VLASVLTVPKSYKTLQIRFLVSVGSCDMVARVDAADPGRPSACASSATPAKLSLALLLLVLAAGLSAFGLLRPISPHDEGLMLQAGSRIAHGQWPYRDFWTNYPPGQALVLAGLDKLFGVSLLSWRIVRVLVDATCALIAYRLVLRSGASQPWALAAWLGVAGAMAWPSGPGPNPPALLLAFAALSLASRRATVAGVLAGLAVLFRLEIGVAAALGVLIAVPPDARRRAAVAALATATVTLAPFFITDPGAMVHDTIGFLGIQGLQRLPLPLNYGGPPRPTKLLEFYFPVILLVVAAVCAGALVVSRRDGKDDPRDRIVLSLAPLALVGVAYLVGRPDEFHLVPLSPVLAVMLAGAAATERHGALKAALKAALTLGLALIAIAGLERRAGQALHPPAAAAVPGPAGSGVHTTPADARSLRRLIATVRRLTRPGQPIFVANPRFDLVRVGDPLLYVILGRPNPTRYDVMQPGLVTTAHVQREIIRSLRSSRTRLVVRWLDPTASAPEHDGAGRSSGVHLLDRYLSAGFRRYARYGDYEVLVAKGSRTIR
jgi:hypothetical protein